MQTITTIGLDIAKSVFQVHGVDAAGQVVIRRQLKRRYCHFKLPHEVFFFRELPKNANGKTQRSEVVRQVLASRA